MRLPWHKQEDLQLDLLNVASEPRADAPAPMPDSRAPSANRDAGPAPVDCVKQVAPAPATATAPATAPATAGKPLQVRLDLLDEDPHNPRIEFPDAELDELVDDIRLRGILQPLVVHPADASGRYRIHFGAKRLRAARRAGLPEVPVVVRDGTADPYAQVAENTKRHGLTPLDLARFIKSRVEAGESNATIAKCLGMNATTVAHHLGLLELPPVLDAALKTGRCTSPRTLHELRKLHDEQPEQARALVQRDADITRTAVKAVRSAPTATADGLAAVAPAGAGPTPLLAQLDAACQRLERLLERLNKVRSVVAVSDLETLRQRLKSLAARLGSGV